MTTVVIATNKWTSWPDVAGATWVPIQYVVGFARLGVEAIWVDHLRRVDPRNHVHSLEYLMTRFATAADDFGFADRWCVIYDGGARYFGLTKSELLDRASSADLLLAISGKGLPKGSALRSIRRRAYIDVDPGFTQMWARQVDMGLDQFDHFFTVGQNVGRPGFQAPTLGLRWHRILPPVVLDLWPANIDEDCTRFSTIADLWGKQYIRFEGEYFGSKRDQFLRFVDVPVQAGRHLEIALTVHQTDHKDLRLLNRSQWRVVDPYLYAGDLHSYREYIRYSRGEFSIAKDGYVRASSGWVSDRSACYLASGKPVIVQSTGFEGTLPTGEGLLTFRTPQEAAEAIQAVDGDYLRHARAARHLAETHFDSDRVLHTILERTC